MACGQAWLECLLEQLPKACTSRRTLSRVEDPILADFGDFLFTTRLRLEPVGPANAADLWLVHNDDEVSYWYENAKPSIEQAEQRAKSMSDSWRFHGVHKWIAYDRCQRRGYRSRRIVAHASRRRLGSDLRVPSGRAVGARRP